MPENSGYETCATFQLLDDGRRVFVPGGELGSRAYLIENDAVEERLRRTMRRVNSGWYLIPSILGFNLYLFIGLHFLVREQGLSFLIAAPILIAPFWGLWRVFEARVSAGLERVQPEKPLGIRATAQQSFLVRPLVFVAAGLGIFFLAVSVPMLYVEGAIIGGGLCAFSVWLWRKIPASSPTGSRR